MGCRAITSMAFSKQLIGIWTDEYI